MVKSKIILVVRDGEFSEETKGNTKYIADTPNNNRYMNIYPWTLLKCTENAVGLPEVTQGGSEPGHITIGAGRVVQQPLQEINMAIRDGRFYTNRVLQISMQSRKESKLHLMGLRKPYEVTGENIISVF
jgi:2,3-bisphosphoglycerate-independent phosphoglycerate mutase